MSDKPAFNDFESGELVDGVPEWAIKARRIAKDIGIQIVRGIPLSLGAISFVLAWLMRELDNQLYKQLSWNKAVYDSENGDTDQSRRTEEQPDDCAADRGSEVPQDDIEGTGDGDQVPAPIEVKELSTLPPLDQEDSTPYRHQSFQDILETADQPDDTSEDPKDV